MTNVRLKLNWAEEWLFCPYCGAKTELDQSPDLLVRYDNGDLNVEQSENAGFDFSHSVRHCGYHIRLWVPEDGVEELS